MRCLRSVRSSGLASRAAKISASINANRAATSSRCSGFGISSSLLPNCSPGASGRACAHPQKSLFFGRQAYFGDLCLFCHCCCARAVVLFHCDPLLTRRNSVRLHLLPTRENQARRKPDPNRVQCRYNLGATGEPCRPRYPSSINLPRIFRQTFAEAPRQQMAFEVALQTGKQLNLKA